jgi:hypothetical protein
MQPPFFSRRFLPLLPVFAALLVPLRAETTATPPTSLPIPTAEQIDTIAAQLPAQPYGVGRPITDRAAWAAAIQQPYFQKQLRDAAQYAKEPDPAITEDLYYEYRKDNRRDTYEKPYDLRTKRLIAFVIAECAADDGKHLPLIEAELNSILGEATWTLPGYSKNISDQEEVARRKDIDLAVAARGWTVATADYWLGDKLKPETRQRIRAVERERVINPYEAAVKAGKVKWWWMASDNNWDAVCTAGVVGTALTLVESPKERALFVQGAENSMTYYLSGFAADGYCYEGPSYWIYGFGNYLSLAETLFEQSKGQINLFQGEKVRNIALYMQRFEMLPGVYAAFGDASAKTTGAPDELRELINARWNMGWTDLHPAKSTMFATHPLSDRLFGFGLFGFPFPAENGTMVAGSPAAPDEASDDKLRRFFKEASVLVTRSQRPGSPDLALALKGGNCGHNHGHNDSGTYVVATHGKALVVDPGMEGYTALSFGPHRFDSMFMNSYGHDVPYIGKTLQKGGVTALGQITATTFTDDRDIIDMDLTTSYDVPALVKVTRNYVFDRTKPSVTVTDTADFTAPTDYGCALITYGEYKETGPGSFLIYDGDAAVQATTTVTTAPDAKLVNSIEVVQAHPPGPKHPPMRLGFNLDQPITHVVMVTTIVPVTAPEPAATATP